MFRRKSQPYTVTDALVEAVAAAIHATKYKGHTLVPKGRVIKVTEHDRKYARAAIEAMHAYQNRP